MADSYKRNENERKASEEWLNNSRSNFERALSNIDKYQERKLLIYQILLLVFVGGFFVNLLSSTFYDLLIVSDLAFQRVCLDRWVIVGSIITLLVIFFLVRWQLSKYKSPLPVVSFLIKPENTEAFLYDSQFKELMEYLEQVSLKILGSLPRTFLKA